MERITLFQTLKKLVWFLLLVFLPASAVFSADNDGDGLSNEVEADLGSDPNLKDIFIEVDWLVVNGRDLKPREGFVDALQIIYITSPTLSAGGHKGIRIHIELSDAIPDNRNAIGFQHANGAYDWTDFDAIKQKYFTPSKRNTHHYCLFVKDIGDKQGNPQGSSGLSRNKGNFRLGASDFIVALGGDDWFNYPTPGYYKWTQIGTFMHELGHNLGLKHGGVADHINFKPNHLSVMNYAFQTDGIPLRTDSGRVYWFDYSDRVLPPLNEHNLNEQFGLGPNAELFDEWWYGTRWYQWDGNKFVMYETFNGKKDIDWNQDQVLESSLESNLNQDVRIDPQGNVFHKFSTLKGSEEWSKLVFNGGLIGKTGIMEQSMLPKTTSLKCLTFKEHRERNGVPRVLYPHRIIRNGAVISLD